MPLHFHRHAIEGVCAFLELRELAAAQALNCDWAAAVHSMSPLRRTLCERRYAQLFGALKSAMVRRHIGAIVYESDLIPSEVARIGEQCPQLKELHCELEMDDEVPEPLCFPPQLEVLCIRPRFRAQDKRTSMRILVESISALKELHSLTLRSVTPTLSLAPLLPLSVRKLALEFSIYEADQELLLLQLRSWSSLTDLSLIPPSNDWMRRLLATPLSGPSASASSSASSSSSPDGPSFSLRMLNICESVNYLDLREDVGAMLVRSQSHLTSLSAHALHGVDFTFFKQLPQLRQLHLRLVSQRSASWTALLQQFTAGSLAQLRMLSFIGGLCTDDDMKRLLQGVPLLTELRLSGMGSLQTLDWLAQPSLSRSLIRLTLDRAGWPQLSVAHFAALDSFTALEELRMWHWPRPPRSDAGAEEAVLRSFKQRLKEHLKHICVIELTMERKDGFGDCWD
jgi:hypothetical protein